MDGTTCDLCSQDAQRQYLQDLPGSPRVGGSRVNCRTCGTYQIEENAILKIREETEDQIYLLSAKARATHESGNKLTITRDNFRAILEPIAISLSPLDGMDRALEYVRQRQGPADRRISIDTAHDYPLVYAHDPSEFEFLLQMLVDRRLLDKRQTDSQYRLTPEGWEKSDQVRRTSLDSDQAFVAMWFDDSVAEAWSNGIKPALTETGFRPLRVDKVEHNEKIDDRIVAEIRRSGLLVADFTGNRSGVYFEAGLAIGLGISVIWTCKNTDIAELHFDTEHYNHIVWSAPADLKEKLINRIAATLPGRAQRAGA